MRKSSIHLLSVPVHRKQYKNSKVIGLHDNSDDISSIIDASSSSDIFYSYLNSPQQSTYNLTIDFTSDLEADLQANQKNPQSNTQLTIYSQENISIDQCDQKNLSAFNQEFVNQMSKLGSNRQEQRSRKWTPKEDNLLINYHKQFNGKWEDIAKEITGRNASQCFQRWRRLYPPIKQKAQFNDRLDQLLKQLVQLHGYQWTKIAQSFPQFQPKQLRDRYINNLDENVNRDPFTPEEDQIILELYQEHGARWKSISKKLINRTDNAVKNRFYGNLRKQYFGIQNPYQIIYKKT